MATCLQSRVLDSNAIMQCPGLVVFLGSIPLKTEKTGAKLVAKRGSPGFLGLKITWPMANDPQCRVISRESRVEAHDDAMIFRKWTTSRGK